MTVSSTNRKAGPFAGDGVNVRFPFVFKVFSQDDVRAVYADALGAESDLILDSDFTVTLNSDQENAPGGEVVLSIPPPTGETLTLTSKVQALQKVKITNAGGFYPSVQNTVFDKLTVLVQQLAEQVSRAVKVKISSNTNPDELVADLQDKAASAVQSATLVLSKVQTILEAKEAAVQSQTQAQEAQNAARLSEMVAKSAQAQAQLCQEQVEHAKTQAARDASASERAATRANQWAQLTQTVASDVQKMLREAKQLSTPADGSVTTDKLAPNLALTGSPTAPTPNEAKDSSTKIATTAFTQAAILAAFNGSNQRLRDDDGFQKLPGGLILQWGRQRTKVGSSETITFPLKFPTEKLVVIVTAVQDVLNIYPTPAYATNQYSDYTATPNDRDADRASSTFNVHGHHGGRVSVRKMSPEAEEPGKCWLDWFALGY